jgi:hypothetical protein
MVFLCVVVEPLLLDPLEPFLLTIDDLNLEHGVVHIGKITETKRAFITFLRPELLDWVKSVYLPHRESWVGRMAKMWKASKPVWQRRD